MQELRSTDILDKEILSESRKKAEKILKNADSECEELLESVDENIQKAKAEKQKFYDKKLEIFEKNKRVSIPLEKQRFEITFIENALLSNINDYLKSAEDSKKLQILLSHFNGENASDKKLTAYVYGFDESKISQKELSDEISKKIGKSFLKCEKTDFGRIVQEDSFGMENPVGIILESEDKNYRCRLTFSEVLEEILDENRAELTSALFGGEL